MNSKTNLARETEDAWREASPYGLRRYADEYITVGRDALDKYRERESANRGPNRNHVPPNRIVPFPIYYNFLHGVELGLKAYLLHVEAVTIENLKSGKFGHNLANLLSKALDYKLRNDCPELTDCNISVICFSGDTYANKLFEYIKIQDIQLLPIDEIADTAYKLISGLKQLPMKTASEVKYNQE